LGADLSSNDEYLGPIASINVTPFVDVALVLLVIFMITAPLILKDAIKVQLPKAVSVDSKSVQSLGVIVTRQGQILLNGQPLERDALITAVQQAVQANPDAEAIISADTEARHGDVVHAIDLIKTAGLSHFAFQIERP